jgi:hypothetical protein
MDFNSYSGNYVILTSDRLILNAKADSLFLNASKTIGFSAVEQVHFNIGPLGKRDPEKHFLIVNSPRIQFGLPKDGKNEPVAKAESVIDYINEMVKIISDFAFAVSNATAVGVGVSKIPEISVASAKLKADMSRIKNKFGIKDSPIKSKITNTI